MGITILIGNSGAGKDWAAANIYSSHQVYKMNQPFKDQFEEDHFLPKGICNNKAHRRTTISYGPKVGKTIQQGMVEAYTESEALEGYGAKYAGITLVHAVNFFSWLKRDAKVVITDLRKPTEMLAVIAISQAKKIPLDLVHVTSNQEIPQDSDKDIPQCIELYQKLVSAQYKTLRNVY